MRHGCKQTIEQPKYATSTLAPAAAAAVPSTAAAPPETKRATHLYIPYQLRQHFIPRDTNQINCVAVSMWCVCVKEIWWWLVSVWECVSCFYCLFPKSLLLAMNCIAVNGAIFKTDNLKQIFIPLHGNDDDDGVYMLARRGMWHSNEQTIHLCIRLIFWHLFAFEIFITINLIALFCLTSVLTQNNLLNVVIIVK